MATDNNDTVELDLDEEQEVNLEDLTMDQIQDMIPGFMRGVSKPGKYMSDRYYRGETKKLRRRTEVKAKRKAQRDARKNNRVKVRGQKRVKGQRFRMQ
jgi:hypothetical protein